MCWRRNVGDGVVRRLIVACLEDIARVQFDLSDRSAQDAIWFRDVEGC